MAAELDPNNLRTYPVQPKSCKTCPFGGEKPLPLTSDRYQYYLKNLLGNGQHLCHSVDNKMICRGGREIQLRWLCSIGAISEATDAAFNIAVNEVVGKVKQ